MTTFAQLGLSTQLAKTLETSGYTEPTPIQKEVIPLMLDGRDIVGIAQTGTGKTAAFVLPVLEKLQNEQHKVKQKHCTALIIAPTRELAAQIDDNIEKYSASIYHARAMIVGGVKYPKQISKLRQGLDILVATPGRLEDHIKSGNVSLAHTQIVILDEADQMLDLGFFPAIRRIVKQAPRTRQTVLLSATMPKQIRALATELLTNPVDVAVATQSKPIEKIDQRFYMMEASDKRPFLVRALENQFRTIVFTRTKHGADQLVKYLSKQNVRSAAIHGDKSQGQRQKAIEDFRSGKEQILVATDIAARGIDIPEVSLVVNYDVPLTPEAYVHRIGRTARAGREGMSITLSTGEEKSKLRDIERLIKRKLVVENVQAAKMSEGYDPTKLTAPTEANETHVSLEDVGGGGRGRRGGRSGKGGGGAGAAKARPFRSAKPGGRRDEKSSSGRPERPERSDGEKRKPNGHKNEPRGPAKSRAGERDERGERGERVRAARPSGDRPDSGRSGKSGGARSDVGKPSGKPSGKPQGRFGDKPGAGPRKPSGKPGGRSGARSGGRPGGKPSGGQARSPRAS